MHRGYIKLHRSLIDWEWYTEPNMVLFFVHCMIRANHKEGTWKGYKVSKGQFISGRKVLSAETGLSERNVRTCIEKLVKSGELTINNALPTVSVDGISPVAPTPMDNLVCDYSDLADSDGDPVNARVLWELDGSSVGYYNFAMLLYFLVR